jgi:hypothetical protein
MPAKRASIRRVREILRLKARIPGEVARESEMISTANLG